MPEHIDKCKPLSEAAKGLIKLMAKIAVAEHLQNHFNDIKKEDKEHDTSSRICEIQHGKPE
jgi:hypothetical protein